MSGENNHRRILYWEGKHGPWFCYARTDAERDAAYLKLFKFFDEVAGYYQYELESDQTALYEDAKKGDAKAAQRLIGIRSDFGHEYERVHMEHVSDPFDDDF